MLTVCCPEYSISPESNLGGEVFERELLKHLGEEGVRLRVLLAEGLPHDTIENLELVRLKRGAVYKMSSGASFALGILSTFKERRFHLLRAFTQRAILASCQVVRRLINVPLVAHVHHIEGQGRFLGMPLQRWMKGVDAVTTVSNASARAIHETLRVPSGIVHTIYCGVDNQKYRPTPVPQEFRRRVRPTDGIVFGFLGNLISRKVSLLLEIFSEIHRYLPDSSLLVCGKGPCEEDLRRTARTMGMQDSVRFTGFVSEQEKVWALNAMDVFLFPSALEGFGMAPAEAMLVEKPVLASDRGSLPEVIPNGMAGFVLPVEDRGAWVRHATILGRDSDLRTRMGKAGREFVSRRFTWKATAEQTRELYTGVVRKKQHQT